MVTAIERTYTARRGDAWTGESFRISSSVAGFWDKASVKSQMRISEEGPVSHEFSIFPSVVQEGDKTILQFGLSLDPEQSAKLKPGTYFGDIEVSSSRLPKSTVVTYTVDLVGDITR